ncbi:hypothetical protein HBI23_244610 [Parastagonospora nodorum]|nr:hypothetical protein HBI47_126090 [Parastagonospora nodorum]KAH5619288.1 hypothetical protein HBI23_244610 [Parastagonospora nodorum]KAH6044499.1 hypothetical protein HBI67_245050 [Parastagonospora nodorum]KAH6064551.1 hypothetical protein HBI66_170880 [Parastagonospora nodorum]
MSTNFHGDNTNGSTLNQGNIFANGNVHFGNVNNSRTEKDSDAEVYQRCVRRLLRALPDDPSDYMDSLITRNGRWLKGTCEWILKTKQNMDWLDADRPSQLLWITGDPGKGKTMLSLFLISHRHMVVRKQPDQRKLIHFFCGAQDGRNTGISILRSLIYQLLTDSTPMFKHIRVAYSKHGRSLFSDDRFETLWKIFEAMVSEESLDTVTCVLDGLDECIEESLSPLWIKIRGLTLSQSQNSTPKPKARLKIIITSRNYPDSFEHYLHCFPRVKLESELNEEIKKDVAKYIDHRMEELACAERRKPSLHLLRANVKRKLVEGSNGTYLWVNFAISSLKKEACPELEAALDKFPHGLDGMYRRMFLSILRSKRAVVISILRWVATAFRPLTLEALGVALDLPTAIGQELDDAVNDFVNYAGDLLLVTPRDPKSATSTKIVLPVHASMTDFLWQIDNTYGELAEFRLDHSNCHKTLGRKALDYAMIVFKDCPEVEISNPDDASYHEPYRRYPLFEYALTAGLRHLTTASKDYPDLSHPLFDEENGFHQPWMRAQCLAASNLWVSGNISILHVAALLGHVNLVAYYLKVFPDRIDTRDERQRTPLFFAVLREHAEMVADLLRRGADPNSKDFVSQTPLHIACATDCQSVVVSLLERGADTNAYSMAKDSVWGSLEAGSLLDDDRTQGEDDSLRNNKAHTTGTAIHFAAEYNQYQYINLLIKYGSKVSAVDGRGQTALHRVVRIEPHHTESTKALLDAGIDILAKDDRGRTAFHIAATSCDNDDTDHDDSMALMLDAKFPVDEPTSSKELSLDGITALQIACGAGLHASVKNLLKRGANANHQDKQGRTPLHHLAGLVQDISGIFAPSIASTLLRSMSTSGILATDSKRQIALDVARATWAKFETEYNESEGGDKLRRKFRQSWLAGSPSQKQSVHSVIKSYVALITSVLPEAAEDNLPSFIGIASPSEEDTRFCELLRKQRQEYRAMQAQGL